MLVIYYQCTVRIWDAATGQLQRELKRHSQSVTSVAFSPNGARVASGSHDNTVRIWDAATGQLQTANWSLHVAFLALILAQTTLD